MEGEQLDAHNELTLMEHCKLWEKDTGMKLSYVTVHRLSNRLGISRKKRRFQPAYMGLTRFSGWVRA